MCLADLHEGAACTLGAPIPHPGRPSSNRASRGSRQLLGVAAGEGGTPTHSQRGGARARHLHTGALEGGASVGCAVQLGLQDGAATSIGLLGRGAMWVLGWAALFVGLPQVERLVGWIAEVTK